MSDGIMKVLQDTSATCVIRVGGAGLLAWALFLQLPLIGGLVLLGRLSPWWSKRVAHGWSMLIPAVAIGLFAVFAAGETDVLTLSRDAGTLQIATTKFFLFNSKRTLDLRTVYNAANTGRYNQFQINLADGNYIYIGNDTTEGGRAESADAFNAWLSQYRGEPPKR